MCIGLKYDLQGAIGSTATGTGAALVRRIQRSASDSFAKDIPALQPYLRDTTELLTHACVKMEMVVLKDSATYSPARIEPIVAEQGPV